ncbi:MAG: hypothetical protein ACT452_11800 [Microthrixaceae bacterium]
MARQSHRISFATFAEMAAHLDRWADATLVTPEAWAATLVDAQSWLDYSARNQALLASYGADGPVAGTETWRLVPSTEPDRPCVVRAGEHGYPVRVPVTTGGHEPDPYLGGTRPTRAAVERWEWRPVFSIDQLARRPAPDALLPIEVPATLTGPYGNREFLTATRRVATSTIRGRLPKLDDPHQVLVDAAGRLPRAKRPAVDGMLADQVAWLVADRVGHTSTSELPPLDPSGWPPRERWERLLDVLEPARKLTAGLGLVAGVDLVASPLPRMTIVDDRVVPAGRRHRLPAASLEQLPVGRWVTVGPYTQAEWTARGEDATGSGAYLRLNKTAYLVAIETGTEARWRLEDVASRTGQGLLTTGTAPDLDAARTAAVSTVQNRYPALTPHADIATVSPAGTVRGWEAMPGEGRSAAELCHLTDQITLYVIPGPGGRWMPAVHAGPTGVLERFPLTRGIEEARDAAELAGHRAARALAVADPVRLDQIVTELADSGDYTRTELATLIGHHLDEPDRRRLDNAAPADLVEVLGDAGMTPAATVAVLFAEGIDADTMAGMLPTIGVPMPDAISVLRDRWDIAGTEAAMALGATAQEMRDAGCTPVEIMAARPRDILRALPEDPHLWELAAGTMAGAGHRPHAIAAHLVAHAPTLDAFAAGITVGIDNADLGLPTAARFGATGDQLAAASEAYGLSPTQAAGAIRSAGLPDELILDMLDARCDHDPDVTEAIATELGISTDSIHAWRHPAPIPAITSIGDGNDAVALLAVLPPPGPSVEVDPIRLLDALPVLEPSLLEPSRP